MHGSTRVSCQISPAKGIDRSFLYVSALVSAGLKWWKMFSAWIGQLMRTCERYEFLMNLKSTEKWTSNFRTKFPQHPNSMKSRWIRFFSLSCETAKRLKFRRNSFACFELQNFAKCQFTETLLLMLNWDHAVVCLCFFYLRWNWTMDAPKQITHVTRSVEVFLKWIAIISLCFRDDQFIIFPPDPAWINRNEEWRKIWRQKRLDSRRLLLFQMHDLAFTVLNKYLLISLCSATCATAGGAYRKKCSDTAHATFNFNREPVFSTLYLFINLLRLLCIVSRVVIS